LSAVAKTLERGASTKGRKPYTYVFLAMHVFRYEDGHDNIRVIGIFSSKRRAQEAIRRLRGKPGFRYRKRAFEISRYVLDLRHWTEGFGGGPLARRVRAAPKSVK
jgi:hypothetical protein